MTTPIEPPSPPRMPGGPVPRPPSIVAVLLLDLIGMVMVGLSLFMLLSPDQQLIPPSTGLPANTIGLLLFGMILVALAAYFLIKRMRMLGRLRKSVGGNHV